MLKNHLAFGYILLVGVPLLILAGVLRAGAHLAAPPAISGDWVVEHAPGPCAAPLGNVLHVQQTGADLVLTLAGPRATSLNGTLAGARLTAAGHGFRFEATVSGPPPHRSWKGQFFADGPCAPVEFRAAKSAR
jgi:hypothetical protein